MGGDPRKSWTRDTRIELLANQCSRLEAQALTLGLLQESTIRKSSGLKYNVLLAAIKVCCSAHFSVILLAD